MSFRVLGLDPAQFHHLFGLSDEALAGHGVQRRVVDAKPGFPDRIEVRDGERGESMLLLNYYHQPAQTPYRASHAIFVREGAEKRYDEVDVIPDVLRIRPISLRAFDQRHEMIDAELIAGTELAVQIEKFLANASVAYLHAHYAKRGCYAARIERA